MNTLEGPRMYYSLFGPRGLFLGAQARIWGRPIEVVVTAPGVLHPFNLRLRTTDVALCREIIVRAQYEWRFPQSPGVIVDAGANIGLATIFYANKCPAARIIAIEPEPSNYQMLLKNTAPYPNVIPIHAALWKEAQTIAVFNPASGHTAFQTREGSDSPAAVEGTAVQAVTLDGLMLKYEIPFIDLLKVDIEGSEKEVFEHSSGWIDRVGIIAIETHDWFRAGCSESVHQATHGFHEEWQAGEVTYLARERLARPVSAESRQRESPSLASLGRSASRFPLRILSSESHFDGFSIRVR